MKRYDAPETEEDLDELFGPGDSAQRGNGGHPLLSVEDVADPLPHPTLAIYVGDPEPVEWAAQDLFAFGDIGLTVGDGGSFKSTTMVHVAGAIAGGYAAFDRFPTTKGRVLYCSNEDPLGVLQTRLEAFVTGHGWDRSTVLNGVYWLAMSGLSLRSRRWQLHIEKLADDLRLDAIIFDPFVDVSGLEDENSNSEASKVTAYARDLARGSGAAVVFVHHANKSSDRSGQARIRGASAIANASRGTLFLEFSEAGVLVQQIKQSYAAKIPNFMLVREIASDPANRAKWTSARLTTAKPEDVRLNRAQEFVLTQVTASPRQLTSSAIKAAAEGTGVRAEDVSSALRTLHGIGRIEFEKGTRGSRYWYPSTLPNAVGNLGESTLPTLPNNDRASSKRETPTLPPVSRTGASHVDGASR